MQVKVGIAKVLNMHLQDMIRKSANRHQLNVTIIRVVSQLLQGLDRVDKNPAFFLRLKQDRFRNLNNAYPFFPGKKCFLAFIIDLCKIKKRPSDVAQDFLGDFFCRENCFKLLNNLSLLQKHLCNVEITNHQVSIHVSR
jgi:hypothetical protein